MCDASIVIVNWNTKRFLLSCLASIKVHTRGIDYEIFVVDNASTDGSADAVAQVFPEVHLIRNNANLGFSRASNQAIRQAQGRYILLLNPDAQLIDDTIVRMIGFLDNYPDIGAMGCRIVNESGHLDPRCARREPTLLTELFHEVGLDRRFPHSSIFGRYLMTNWDHTTDREVEVLSGACLMVRHAAIDAVGLLDEGFFMYGEDIDLCARMRAADWRVYFFSQGTIVHIGDASANQVRGEMNLEKIRSRYRYFRKHRGTLYAFTYRTLILLASLFKQTFYLLQSLTTAGNSNMRKKCRNRIKFHRQVFQWALLARTSGGYSLENPSP